MSQEELEERFPKLRESTYSISSEEDFRYNCIAFALGDKRQWWEPNARLCYWPLGVSTGDTLEGWIRVYELHGYVHADTHTLESEFEKVALYVDLELSPTHVAKQLPSGMWTSKLGRGHDIEHASLESLEGDSNDEYGIVAQIMKRPRNLK